MTLAGLKSLQAASGSLTSATSNNFTISAAPATQLAFVQQPSDALAGMPISPAVTVQLKDQFGNSVSQANTSITVSLFSGSGELSGTLSQLHQRLRRRHIRQSQRQPDRRQVVCAASGSLTAATSTGFNVSTVTDRVEFAQQPAGTTAGVVMAPVTVQLKDQFGNLINQANVAVNLAMIAGNGTLIGTLTQLTDGSGVATFTDLRIQTAGIKTLQALSAGLLVANSANFAITAAAATKLAFLNQPKNVQAGVTMPPVKVQLEDQFGNAVAQGGVTVKITLKSGKQKKVYTAKTNAAGQAVFKTLAPASRGAGQLVAQSAGLLSASSRVFQVLINPNFPWL